MEHLGYLENIQRKDEVAAQTFRKEQEVTKIHAAFETPFRRRPTYLIIMCRLKLISEFVWAANAKEGDSQKESARRKSQDLLQ